MSSGLVALVVGGVDYGDADRVVHLLTANGRLSVFAHGAKKSKKRFAGALEPFATIHCTLAAKPAHGMPTLQAATVDRPRLALRDRLERIALASYVVELSSKVAPEASPSEPILELAERTLDHLASATVSVADRRAFELRLLDVLGYRPQTEACAVCGKVEPPFFLDLSIGGALCEEHRTIVREVGPKTLEWMTRVLSSPDPTDALVGLDVEWAERASRALTAATATFFQGLLPKPLASLRLLEDVGL